MAQQEHSFANPGPAGLIALALVCFCFFAILTGRVPHEVLPLLACWQAGGFIVQIITGIIELKDHNVVGGNVFTYFAAFFMLTGALESITKYLLLVNKLPFAAQIDGWAWLVLAIATTMLTPAYLLSTPFLLAALITADIGIWAVALMDLGVVSHAVGAPIAAWFLLFTGILGLYIALGIVMNTAFKRTIIPLGKPLVRLE